MTDDTLPYAPAVPSSRQAAEEALAGRKSLADAVYMYAERARSQGITEDEVADALQLGRPTSTSVVNWLKQRNRLAYVGRYRLTRSGRRAQVLVAMPPDRWRDAPPRRSTSRRYYAIRLDPASHHIETRGPLATRACRDAQLQAMAAAPGPAILYGLDADAAGRLTVSGPLRVNPPAAAKPAGYLFDPKPHATEQGL